MKHIQTSEIRRALRPVNRRLRLLRLLRGAALGACAGGALCLAWMLLSFVIPIRQRLPLSAALFLTPSALAGAVNALRPVSPIHAAQLADAHGLKERTQTALALNGNSPMEQLQRADAREALDHFDPRCIPLPRLRRPLCIACAAAILSGALCMLPNPQSAAIDRALAFERAMESASEQAAAEAEKTDEALSDEDRQELRRLLQDLSRELRQSENSMDAMLSLGRAEDRLEKLRERTAGDALHQIAEALRAQGLNALSEALESGDPQVLKDALDVSDVQSIEAAASQQNGELQSQLNAAAQALRSGNALGALNALSNLQSGAQSSSASLNSASQLLSSLRSSVGSGMQGGSSGSSPGSGLGQNTGKGSGAGKGSTNLNQGTSSESGVGERGSNAPRYMENEYERIYDPTRLDAGQTEFSAESSAQNEGGSDQLQLGPGAGTLGDSVPYDQVVYEYARAASQAADSRNLSAQERAWVNDYFAALTR